jgi:hypothetical protein
MLHIKLFCPAHDSVLTCNQTRPRLYLNYTWTIHMYIYEPYSTWSILRLYLGITWTISGLTWTTPGLYLDFTWTFQYLDYIWTFQYLDYTWTLPGLSQDYTWTIPGPYPDYIWTILGIYMHVLQVHIPTWTIPRLYL